MIKAVIFDCFGVIVTDKLAAMQVELARQDAAAASEVGALARATNSGIISADQADSQMAWLMGLDVAELRRRIAAGEGQDIRLLDMIRGLRARYKTALLSNVSGEGLRRRFSAEELESYFDVALASGDIGYGKPDIRAFQAVADRLNIALDECVLVDDNAGHCAAARQAGLQAIHYTAYDQLRVELDHLLESG